MKPLQCEKEKRSLRKPISSSKKQEADNDEYTFRSSPCPSPVDSASDDSDNDPTYEYSDKYDTNESESSSEELSDSEQSCSILPVKSSISSTVVSDSENHILLNLTNALQHEEALNVGGVEKFQFSAYVSQRKIGKKRTFCKFCKNNVTNFERHLMRHHTECKEVRDMLRYTKKSKEPRRLIQLIRNDGNFKEFLQGRVIPLYHRNNVSVREMQPCAHCKGIYKKSFLYRHFKKCPAAKIHENPRKIKHLSASQTLIACSLETNDVINKLRVKTEVFDKMKADKISFVAKTDPLIYLFGDNYLKSHFRAQMSTACSNKMRELARLLITLREIEKNENLKVADAIDPSMFEKVVECAKIMGGFDPISKRYKKSPSLSAHPGTSLKGVCNLILYLLQSNNKYIDFDDVDAKYKAAKRLRDLVTTQWTTEISSLAFKTLNEQKWNRPTILPLHLQELMNVLVEIRTTTNLVPESNVYLFAHPGSNNWIRADSVLRKFSRECNIDHPEYMTSNNLRKQIATVMQILNLSPDETKQFAKFMGHTGKTHDDFYTLTEDAYQTAKISKLLIIMDKGGGHEYKRKSLNEIDINPELDTAYMEDSEDEEIPNLPPEQSTSSVNSSIDLTTNSTDQLSSNFSAHIPAHTPVNFSSSSSSNSSAHVTANFPKHLSSNLTIKPCKQTGRSFWSQKQKSIINSYFKSHIQRKITPRKSDCESFKNKYPDLYNDKDWVRIKTFVYNTFRNKD